MRLVLRYSAGLRSRHVQGKGVNSMGIALGHPLGATGAMILGLLVNEMERRDVATGLVTLCIGAGMGLATIIERGVSECPSSISPKCRRGRLCCPRNSQPSFPAARSSASAMPQIGPLRVQRHPHQAAFGFGAASCPRQAGTLFFFFFFFLGGARGRRRGPHQAGRRRRNKKITVTQSASRSARAPKASTWSVPTSTSSWNAMRMAAASSANPCEPIENRRGLPKINIANVPVNTSTEYLKPDFDARG